MYKSGKKRLISFVGLLVGIISLVAVACAPTPTPTPTPEKPKKPEVFEWRFQAHWPAVSASYDPWKKWFEEDLLEMTDGRLKIDFNPAGTFMPAEEMFRAWSEGTLDGGISFAPYYASQIPLNMMQAYWPYSLKDVREYQYFQHHLGFEKALQKRHLEYGILFWTGQAYPAGPIFKKPIRTLDDLQGVKLRAFGPLAEWFKRAGAATTYIPGPEIYTALSKGVVDGAIWGGAAGSASMKFYEVAKYYMQPYSAMCGDCFYISKKSWDKLPKDLQKTVRAAIGERFWQRSVEYFVDVESPARKKLKEHGVKFVRLDEVSQKKLKKIAVEIWNEKAEKYPSIAKWVEKLTEFNRELGYLE